MKSSLAVLAFLAAPVSVATTVLYQDVPALSRASDVVVRGTVTRLESRWTGDGRRIVTDIRVEVAETLKGSARASVLIRAPGGVVGDIGQRVEGLATFKQGEEVVVFLERRPDDSFVVSGAAQGKFTVERSADGRGVFAVPDANVAESSVIDPVTRQPTTIAPKTFALDELRREIAAATSSAGPSPGAGVPQKGAPKATGTK